MIGQKNTPSGLRNREGGNGTLINKPSKQAQFPQ
jgi:hypothetical protein